MDFSTGEVFEWGGTRPFSVITPMYFPGIFLDRLRSLSY